MKYKKKLQEPKKAFKTLFKLPRASRSQKSLKGISKVKWDYLKQRSKSKWDAFGDNSTSFFFKSVTIRSSRNEIRAIKNQEGKWMDSQEDLKDVFYNYFKELFTPDPSIPKVSHNDLIFDYLPKLSPSQLKIISKPFLEEENKIATFSPKPLKSPAPYGFSLIFSKKTRML